MWKRVNLILITQILAVFGDEHYLQFPLLMISQQQFSTLVNTPGIYNKIKWFFYTSIHECKYKSLLSSESLC